MPKDTHVEYRQGLWGQPQLQGRALSNAVKGSVSRLSAGSQPPCWVPFSGPTQQPTKGLSGKFFWAFVLSDCMHACTCICNSFVTVEHMQPLDCSEVPILCRSLLDAQNVIMQWTSYCSAQIWINIVIRSMPLALASYTTVAHVTSAATISPGLGAGEPSHTLLSSVPPSISCHIRKGQPAYHLTSVLTLMQ